MPNNYNMDITKIASPFESFARVLIAANGSFGVHPDDIREKVASTKEDVAVAGLHTAYLEGFKAALNGNTQELETKIACEQLGTQLMEGLLLNMVKSLNSGTALG